MRRLFQWWACLLLMFAGVAQAETEADSFFEFSDAKKLAEPVIAELATAADDVLVLKGAKIEDGFYRISAQTLTEVIYKDGKKSEEKTLAKPPVAAAELNATLNNGQLFIATKSTLYNLDLKNAEAGWQKSSDLPEAASAAPSMVSLNKQVYVTGLGAENNDTFSYNPIRNEWKKLNPATIDGQSISMLGMTASTCGDEHLIFLDTTKPSDRILIYYRVMDEWLEHGKLPKPVPAVAVTAKSEPGKIDLTVFTATESLAGKVLQKPTKYHWINHLVVVLLIIALIAIGSYFSKKESSENDYFRAGNRIPWWAAGLSLFASGASAISLMAMPGMSFANNWIFFSISIFVVLIQLPLLLFVYIPMIRRLNVATANEYLERRFGLPVRMLGFGLYSLNQMLGRMAAILLLPALALTAIFGLPMWMSILIMGVVATIYVTLGGLEAVIWTDVLQAIVMLLAVSTCCIFAFTKMDIPNAGQIISDMHKLQVFDFSMDWTAPVFLVVLANVIATAMGLIGDQTFIQRIQCTANEGESRKTILTQMAVVIPMNIILFGLGTLLFLYYKGHPTDINPAMKSDGVFPFFAAQNLPIGMAGFVVAALLAATMSTVSGAINSVANLGVEDIYRRFFPKATDQKCVILGRVLTISLGIFGTVAALWLASLNERSVWELALKIMGMILSPISGIFCLGVFTRRANSFGAWFGTVASWIVAFVGDKYLNVHGMVFLAIGIATCIVVGYIASFFAPQNKDLKGLTIFTLLAKK